jgi:hypothetical protein
VPPTRSPPTPLGIRQAAFVIPFSRHADPAHDQGSPGAYDEALKRIEACRRKGTQRTFLDLSTLGLTQVPPEIGQLTALTQLALHNNQLTSLPPEIGQLTALTGA